MPWTNVQLTANSRDRTGQSTYQNATYSSFNQNLVQGQIHSVSVNEVNFPYDIPNIQVGPGGPGSAGSTNIFYLNLLNVGTGAVEYSLEVVLPIGFYTGTELATAINTAIQDAALADGIPTPAVNVPVCGYVVSANVFAFAAPSAPSDPIYRGVWQFSSGYTFPNGNVGNTNTLGKDIFSLMGFSPLQNPLIDMDPNPGVQLFPFIAAASATLLYTQYIDICSPELCQYQYFRDGSTTNLARRSDVVCRLYISNNVATQEEEGLRPFVILRQFNNARVMRWNAHSSVGSMSIQLYDDVGQPLQYKWMPRPYQITFNVYEQDKDSVTY